MEVILLERITRLGGIGDVVKVKNGYARNFLIPMKKAMRSSEESRKLFEARRHVIEQQNAEARSAAEKINGKLGGTTISLIRQASQEGKLYGSVSIRDVADALKDAGYDIPKSQIVMSGTIKNTGEYPVRIMLHPDVTSTVTLNISRVETEAA